MKFTKGFTLVELILIVGIIGILSAIVIPATTGVRVTARDNRRVSDIKQIQLGLALYFDVNRTYPTGNDISVLMATLVAQKYLPQIPTDPKTGDVYEYKFPSTNSRYCLGAKFEGASLPDDNVACDTGGSTATYKVAR